MAWQQLHAVKGSITWEALKDGWSSKWFQGVKGGEAAPPADYVGVLGVLPVAAHARTHPCTTPPV